MKKGNLLIFVCVAVVIIMILAFAFVLNSEKRVDQLQTALRKSYQHLTNAGNQLIKVTANQKHLENQNQKLISYIEAKETQDNRQPIGFKIERMKDSNDQKINSLNFNSVN